MGLRVTETRTGGNGRIVNPHGISGKGCMSWVVFVIEFSDLVNVLCSVGESRIVAQSLSSIGA